MKRHILVLLFTTLLCTPGLTQEEAETKERSAESRTVERGRKRYDRGKVTVEDPAKFKTEGKTIFSGPQPGEKLTAFKATSLAGDSKGKELDPVSSGKDRPQVIVFQDESGVAIRGLYGIVDAIGKINRKTEKDLHVTCVFLSDDEVKINQFAGTFPKLVEMGIDSIALSKDGRDGPGAYGLNRNVSHTIILAKDGQVTRNFVFPQGLLYSDPHVMGGVAELIGEDRETVAKWLAEGGDRGDRMRMRGGDKDGRAVAKRAFGEKIREFVEAGKLTRAEAGELYKAAFPE